MAQINWLLHYMFDNKEWIFSGIGVAIVSAILWWLYRRRAEGNSQTQVSGSDSINIQAGRDVHSRDITIGITFSEARHIAQDVFNANFYKLSGVAREVAKQRADDLFENFLKKLSERDRSALGSATDPDMQYILFTAQKEYARTGDKDLADILVDILVDRAAHTERSLLQIVLNESLSVAPKLTQDQFDTLSIIFIIRYTIYHQIDGLDTFAKYLKGYIMPFIDNLRRDNSCYRHLEYAGCGIAQISEIELENAFQKAYPGLFWKGISKQKADELLSTWGVFPELIVPCLHHPELFQFSAIENGKLTELCKSKNFSEEKIAKLIGFQLKHLMEDNKVREVLIKAVPEIKRLISLWNNSMMKSFTLTSVGIAIANANIKRKINESFDLSIWIN